MGALSKEHRESETLATTLCVLALSTDWLASLLWSEGCPWCLSAHISFRIRLPIASEVTSSVVKHGFPKCSELYSHNVTLSHEWVNEPAVPLSALVWPQKGLSLPYWVILSSLSAAVTAPAVIEFGLFSLQTLTPDFIEGDGFWKVGDTGRQTLFLCIRWYTVLEPLMWKMPLRPCSTSLLFLPFLSSLEDTPLWFFGVSDASATPSSPSQGNLNLGNSNQVWKKPVNRLWMTTTQNTER